MGGLFLQIERGIQKRLHFWLESLTGRGKTDAVLTANQEIQTDFLLQRVHHMGKARLGIAKLCGGGCQTAPLYRQKQCVNFLAVHGY